uniref:Uncharacterized protein n=1 Tax=Lutzomyia longipalpis TaxID=7200 RepID=A0A1B0CV42_LUTLO
MADEIVVGGVCTIPEFIYTQHLNLCLDEIFVLIVTGLLKSMLIFGFLGQHLLPLCLRSHLTWHIGYDKLHNTSQDEDNVLKDHHKCQSCRKHVPVAWAEPVGFNRILRTIPVAAVLARVWIRFSWCCTPFLFVVRRIEDTTAAYVMILRMPYHAPISSTLSAKGRLAWVTIL